MWLNIYKLLKNKPIDVSVNRYRLMYKTAYNKFYILKIVMYVALNVKLNVKPICHIIFTSLQAIHSVIFIYDYITNNCSRNIIHS